MKNFSLFLLFAVVVCGLAGIANVVRADMAPPTPAYPNTKLNVQVDLRSLYDRFAIIERSSRRGDEYYNITDNFITPDSYLMPNYLALEKDFFENSGGMEGLFTTTKGDDFTNTTPNDAAVLEANSYYFVIKKDDPLLESLFNERGIIENSTDAVFFPFNADYYTRQGEDDSTCQTGYTGGRKNCILGEEIVTYVPGEISGHEILLLNAESENQDITSISENFSDTTSEIVPEVVSESAPQLHWWQRFWNFIKSLF
ncbi:MAG: hypothetical protein UW63_C0043G0011 [Candidatus Uhrbacteria bacterium GW2011_GWF2_44_350]|uniref:Uncharacterized protein n=1 Tax=Candidatus Uhrbacteria bacterium GW2011_GWF2_44_350 TaxID=1619000 RepID=A0A0G1JE07_9BACT|nr:MAG: hypothetical protein UW63_C0043G0011 [Candidatus Uhrbacteria bacterium GW2011_GWF2_44_350]HBR80094.1 hypothetical protein [Candidatus Uhrbacteria bacterium]HCU32206.1 hypothetical protein [Candidatus Uhrbacteria bacterium]